MRMLLGLALIITAVALAGCSSSGCCDAGKVGAAPATYAETTAPVRPVEVEVRRASRAAPAKRTAGAFPPPAPSLPCATTAAAKPACKPACNPLKKLFCDPCPGGVCGVPGAADCCPGGVCGIPVAGY